MDHKQHYSTSPAAAGGWLHNFCQVDWTCIFFIIVLGIATGAIQKTPAVQRPVYLGDATIALPHSDSNSIAFWVALVIPAVILLICAAVLEFAVLKDQSRRQAWLMFLNIILAALASLAVTGFITELFKRICGRLRPDFLARCQPPKPPGSNVDLLPFGTLGFPTYQCASGYSASTISDGHLSFPSGHSSCSMVLGLFGAMYVLWAVHLRGGRDTGPAIACKQGGVCFTEWLKTELLRLVVMLVVLFELAWPWGVAVSRFRDNRHNVSDVVGGLLLGACFAPLFIARLVCHFSGCSQPPGRGQFVDQQDAQEAGAL